MSSSRPAGSPLSPAPLAAAAASAGNARPALDEDSRDWLQALTAGSGDEGVDRLRALLVRAARFEVARRRGGLQDMDDSDLDELARAAADAALRRVLARLDQYGGDSRFTTWATKFALVEAAVRLRRLAWGQNRPAPQPSSGSPDVELSPDLRATLSAVLGALSADQRHVFETLAFKGMPIDILAEELQTTRADVYRTMQSARGVVRACLHERGLSSS